MRLGLGLTVRYSAVGVGVNSGTIKRVNIPAMMGEDCEVPSTAIAEISGKARQVALKEDAGGRP